MNDNDDTYRAGSVIGKRQGTCFPPNFRGECFGIPDLCVLGTNIAQQCGSPCRAGTRNV